jgi:cytochrome c oxidase subunit 3
MRTQTGERYFAIHPSAVMMVLILGGITTLFGALVLSYIYTRADKGMLPVGIPWLFLINSVILMSTGFAIEQCRRYFHDRVEQQTIRWGFITLGLTVVFLVMQGIAWFKLLSTDIQPGTSGGYGYLYAISILHFLHVLAGIPFLLRIIIPLTVAHRQGNAALLFIDDHIKRKLRHTSWYWHFIDVVWICLMVVFLVSKTVG